MPRYWFTTHWPPTEGGGHDPFNIYIQDCFKAELERIGAGDKVFIYEYKSGPNVIDAQGHVIRRRLPGKEAVVCEATLLNGLQRRPGYVPEHFEGKGTKNFCWEAFTEDRVNGFVPRVRVNEAFGYEDGYLFFGFNRGRGIREISAREYADLHALLIASTSERGQAL